MVSCPEEVEEFVEKAAKFPHIRVKGLMTIAPFVDNPEIKSSGFCSFNENYLLTLTQKKLIILL